MCITKSHNRLVSQHCFLDFLLSKWRDGTLHGHAWAYREQDVQYRSYLLTGILYVTIVETFKVGVGQ